MYSRKRNQLTYLLNKGRQWRIGCTCNYWTRWRRSNTSFLLMKGKKIVKNRFPVGGLDVRRRTQLPDGHAFPAPLFFQFHSIALIFPCENNIDVPALVMLVYILWYQRKSSSFHFICWKKTKTIDVYLYVFHQIEIIIILMFFSIITMAE